MQMKSTLLALAMLAATPAFAAETKITVKGSGKVVVAADLFATSFSLETPRQAKSGDALAAIAKSIASQRKDFEALGLKHRANFTLDNPYAYGEYEKSTGQIIGYRAYAHVTLRVPFDHPKVDEIAAKLPNLKGREAGSAVSDAVLHKAKIEASQLMAEDAKEQAEAIASSIGCALGSILTVKTGGDEDRYVPSRMRSLSRSNIITDTAEAGRTSEVTQVAEFVFACTK
jgi:uncharacterized protein YggE